MPLRLRAVVWHDGNRRPKVLGRGPVRRFGRAYVSSPYNRCRRSLLVISQIDTTSCDECPSQQTRNSSESLTNAVAGDPYGLG